MPLPVTTGTELLIIHEEVSSSPVTYAYVDQSSRLHFGDGAGSLGGSERTTYGSILKSRGTANIALNAKAGDDYMPTVGSQVFLYDVAPSGQTIAFAGTIDKIQTSWWGQAGDRLLSLSCASFEQQFDTIRVPGRLYTKQTAGLIFADLLTLATGWPGTAGTIGSGATIDTFLVEGEPTLANLFDKLAALSSYVWSVNISDLTIDFEPPGTALAPFDLAQADVLWEALDYLQDRHDFRDRQIITLDYDAFGRSDEVFVGAGQTAFTLRNPVHQVTNAWITKNTQNHATGTLSGQPSPNDTVTVGYPTSGSIYNWAPNAPYAVGQVVIDPSNHRQVCTTAGTSSNPGPPTWNDIGGETVDNTVRWHDSGAVGFGPYQVAVYTFVSTLNNTLFGQVLIGATAAATLQNLIDAINANRATAGIGYSLPTWENPLVDAFAPSGLTFTLKNKYAGQGFIAALTSTGSAFSWSAALTSGGITTFGTYSLSVGISTAQSRALSYTPGSAVVTLDSPLNAGTNLAVEYQRIDGNVIAVENTPLVAERAAIESGTGKYQALTSDNSATPTQALAEAQAALLAFETIPSTLEFITMRPGLRVNQGITVAFTMPDGPDLTVGQGGAGSTPTLATHPQIRGSSIFTSSASPVLVPFPGSTVAGDLAVIFVAGGNNFFNPVLGDGWASFSFGNGLFISGSGYWKILDAGDIATGSYTINPNTANPGVYSIVTIQAGTFDTSSPIRETPFSRHNPGSTSETLTTSSAVLDTDLALFFGANKSGTVAGISPGSMLGTAAGSTAGNFASYEVPTPGALTATFSYGAGATGDYQCIAIIELGGGTPTTAPWIIQEVEGELLPSSGAIGDYGHWRYTVRCINVAQIGSYVDFWLGLGGGGGGGGASSYSGSPTPPTGSAAGVEVALSGTIVGSEPEINFIPGAGASIAITDDTANQKIDVTISATGIGGVSPQTTNYTLLSGDNGKLVTFSSSSAVTATLPATPPASPWMVMLENRGVGVLTVGRNGNTIDGAAANIALGQGQGLVAYSSGAAYFTMRGLAADSQAANTFWGGPATGSAPPTFRAIASADLPPAPSVLVMQKYVQNWAAQTSVAVTHNFNSRGVIIQVFDAGSAQVVEPETVTITDTNTITVTFGAAFTGYAVVIGAGALIQTNVYEASWTAQTSVTVTHNIGTTSVLVQVTDAGGLKVEPESVTITSSNVVTLTFGAAFTGSVVVVAAPNAFTPIQSYSANWAAQTSVTVTHDFFTQYVIVQVTDGLGVEVDPETVTITTADVVTLTFGAAFTGKVTVIG